MRLLQGIRKRMLSREPVAQQESTGPEITDPRETLISYLVANPGDIEHFHRDARTGLYYDLPGRHDVLLEVSNRLAANPAGPAEPTPDTEHASRPQATAPEAG